MERPWIAAPARRYIEEHEARFEHLSPAELEAELAHLTTAHERYVDRECINLYAGTNAINPRAARYLASSLGSRPSLGHPGAKYNKGMRYAEPLEVLLAQLLRRLFKARYVETRVASGSLANLYAFMATCRPGDAIMTFSDAAAGHPTHHAEGAAGLYGLRVYDVPFDAVQMDIDIPALAVAAERIRPRLIVVAGSLCLFPYSLAKVRPIADAVGADILYDAAHMGGLIAGGTFQDPLAEGADLMTGSTYKSFGGPASGMVLTQRADLAERLDRIAYPGLTANFDLSRVAAMIMATLDLVEFGRDYALQCIANARALAAALADRQVDVFAAGPRGHTASQHVALAAHRYGGGNAASTLIEEANVLFTSIGLPLPAIPGEANGIRLGTQEVTRWGMGPEDMPDIAELVARVLVAGEPAAQVRPDTMQLRARFQTLHYVRGEAALGPTP